jgi:hypothetical protein
MTAEKLRGPASDMHHVVAYESAIVPSVTTAFLKEIVQNRCY